MIRHKKKEQLLKLFDSVQSKFWLMLFKEAKDKSECIEKVGEFLLVRNWRMQSFLRLF